MSMEYKMKRNEQNKTKQKQNKIHPPPKKNKQTNKKTTLKQKRYKTKISVHLTELKSK